MTSRSDRREDIFPLQDGRCVWLEILGEVCKRFHWIRHAKEKLGWEPEITLQEMCSEVATLKKHVGMRCLKSMAMQ